MNSYLVIPISINNFINRNLFILFSISFNIFICYFLSFTECLTAQDPFQKETEEWAQKKMKSVHLSNDLEVPDRETSFENAKKDPALGQLHEWAQAASTQSFESFDGDEEAFQPDLLQNPFKKPYFNKTYSRYSCQERDPFEDLFIQYLIKIIPPQISRSCPGHGPIKVGKASNKKAEAVRKEKEKQFRSDPALSEVRVTKEKINKFHHDLFLYYRHKEGCTETSDPSTSQEIWESDDPLRHESLLEDPDCRITWIKPMETEGNNTKGLPENRSRKVLIQCSATQNSPCRKFRDQGGVLIHRRCVRENAESGDCELWEKTYEIGEKSETDSAEPKNPKPAFWGLGNELPPLVSSSSDPSFAHLHSSLGIFSDMTLAEKEKAVDIQGDTPLFSGTVHECRKNHNVKELEHCCKMKGLLSCSKEEENLKKLHQEGKCHKVGEALQGFFPLEIKRKVYCCFPTKLLRVFQEQARKQMGIGWGSVEAPQCGGFSFQEMEGKVVLEQIDFSEAFETYEIDEEKLIENFKEKIKTSLKNLSLKNPWSQAHEK